MHTILRPAQYLKSYLTLSHVCLLQPSEKTGGAWKNQMVSNYLDTLICRSEHQTAIRTAVMRHEKYLFVDTSLYICLALHDTLLFCTLGPASI